MITVYHNVQCSKSNSVCDLLAQNNIAPNIIEYLNTPPTKEELLELLAMLQMNPSELIRRSEPIFLENYADHELEEDAYLQAMLDHPILIERPIVVKDGKAIIGRPVERVRELL